MTTIGTSALKPPRAKDRPELEMAPAGLAKIVAGSLTQCANTRPATGNMARGEDKAGPNQGRRKFAAHSL
jgi:hypothetical protein